MRVLIDNREPGPVHPWQVHFSDAVTVEWGTLETGDLAAAALPDGAVVERKTVPDFLACVGRERERFERELRRSRYVGRFVVIVEGTLLQCLQGGAQGVSTGRGPGVHPAALLGSVAAWSRRFCPILFAGDIRTAASLAESFLRGQVKDAERVAKALATDATSGFSAPAQRRPSAGQLPTTNGPALGVSEPSVGRTASPSAPSTRRPSAGHLPAKAGSF